MTFFAKLLLYNLSLVPLYILFIVKKVDISGFECIIQEYSNIEFYKVLYLNNISTLLLLLLVLLSIFAFKKLIGEVNSGYGLPEQFTDIKNIDFNHLTFIATYILPLLAFTLDSARDVIFMIVLLAFIGTIYIKTNLYYLSPVFILFGIKIYSAIDTQGEEKIIMSEEKNIKTTEYMHYTKIGDIYFAKRSGV
jgi:multisubunit Na+/H+ antiporter MnhF subunit